MLAQRLSHITATIQDACQRAGRSVNDVKIVAVTKNQTATTVNAVLEVGLSVIGENRVQEYLAKRMELANHTLHMIGSLQRNKVKAILPFLSMVESVDSLDLALELQRQAERLDRTIDVLMEVNTSEEATKHGIGIPQARDLALKIDRLDRVNLRGLMTVAAPCKDPEEVRPSFVQLRALRDELCHIEGLSTCHHLSMGMSDDYPVAIEEGATLIRLGTALFGPRN